MPNQFATGLLLRAETHELLVSYGEMDCIASAARYPLAPTLASIGARKESRPAAPLLSVLVLLPGGGGSREALTRLLPLLRLLSPRGERGGKGASGEGDESSRGGRRVGPNGRSAKTSHGGHRVTLMLTETCALEEGEAPDALERGLDLTDESSSAVSEQDGSAHTSELGGPSDAGILESLGIIRGCLTCTWASVRRRRDDESETHAHMSHASNTVPMRHTLHCSHVSHTVPMRHTLILVR